MALVDLKRSKKDKAEEVKETAVGPSGDDYPYGACLHLDTEELDKLGIVDLPEVGEEFQITAVAKVTRVSSSASEGSDEQNGVDLQITAMELTSSGGTESEAEDRGQAAESQAVGGRAKTVVRNAYRGRG